MQETAAPQHTVPDSTTAKPRVSARPPLSARWVFLAVAAVTLLLLALLPPYISLNRYGHRISTSIGTSLGRPVHFDHVALNLLPVPSFTITNFVVEEDPAFGAEPIIRANTVNATLRVSSLWRRRIEVARISFTEPSLNLVHDRRGKWNFEGVLLQAAHIDTAPTAQPTPGNTPRFPYIEATGARVNLKEGPEKTPFSLTEADFALWLPDPSAWRMRMAGRPVRTDTSTSDTGSLQLEATLGRASSLETVPLDVQAAWSGAPLGEASRLLTGRDLGLRGEIALTANIHGTLSSNAVQTRLEVNRLRRSDFVPAQSLSIGLDCKAVATRIFHEFTDLRCSWPVPDSGGATLALAGSVPDVLNPALADLQIGTARLPASVLLNWLRIASSRVPPGLSAQGLFSGSITHEPAPSSNTPSTLHWTGQATLPELTLSGDTLAPTPLVLSDLFLHSAALATDGVRPRLPVPNPSSASLVLAPLDLPLGGKDPATLEAQADANGYTLHLTGIAALSRLAALAASVPQFGEGLTAVLPTNRASGPTLVDFSAHRSWLGPQLWVDNLAGTAPPHTPHQPRRKPRRKIR